jgi:hypothetical protein
MRQDLLIIGTHHKYQSRAADVSIEMIHEFESTLENFISKYGIMLVAEEGNKENLKEKNIKSTLPQDVSRKCRIKHLFCEAKRTYRVSHRMEFESDIMASGKSGHLSDSEIEANIQKSYREREKYWLGRIMNKNIWPVLLICGAYHASHFHKLARQNGINAHVLYEDWGN